MLKFHIIIIKFSIFTNNNSQSDTSFPKLKNTIVKIDIKSFSVYFGLLRFLVSTTILVSFFILLYFVRPCEVFLRGVEVKGGMIFYG